MERSEPEFIINLTDFYDRKAIQVLMGKYGDGEIRKHRLGEDYEKIQERVKEIMRWAK